MYIPDEKKVAWIAEYFESKTTDLTADQRKAILEKLVQATGFESFFQTKYVGQKRFSLEGLEATIPALDALIQSASEKRSEEHTSELQSRPHLVCRLLLEKKKT